MAVLCNKCRRLFSSLGYQLSSTNTARSLLTRFQEGLLFPVQNYSSSSFLPDSLSSITEKRKDYSEERVLGYTPEEVYSVVADVNNYKTFLPWCHDSCYVREGTRKSTKGYKKGIAKLAIGFPPLIESYTALVIVDPPNSLRNISTDGRLFSHLENLWHFRKGPDFDTGPTCIINFWVRFEFRSLVYARLGFLFFDEVARTMSSSFEKRCEQLYGPNHLKGFQRKSGFQQQTTDQSKQCIVTPPTSLEHHET